MLAAERIFPATRLPRVPKWLFWSIALNLFQILTVIVAGRTWNQWLQAGSIFHLAALPTWLGALITYFFSTFVFYWWHRIRHESAFWWRIAHQIHHSASRLEILTSFYKHPAEIVINSMLSAIVTYPIMGCSTRQGACYTMLIAFGEMFYHWNIHTPRWLGHWFQRPESHRIHHQRDRHSRNYSDLPVWDKMFGTFANPKNGDAIVCGFGPPMEARLPEMIMAREVDTKRLSEPISFRPACFGCSKSVRCEQQYQVDHPSDSAPASGAPPARR
jgi:sterol desaturase/sphingolipid hydroxylase (fatty acid hydroxylase superfamily)